MYQYVHDVGGGLFTVCGNEYDDNPGDEEWIANAYTKEDMEGSKYQQLLPVEIIEYTPPVAVMIIIDVSGSMWDGSVPKEESKLNAAKQGAVACLDALSERDYVGVIAMAKRSQPLMASAISSLKSSPGVRNSSYQMAISRYSGLAWIRFISSLA